MQLTGFTRPGATMRQFFIGIAVGAAIATIVYSTATDRIVATIHNFCI